ncbi:hypothetical protein DASB73_033700 [Starmerella bacillaris]|uniref:Uncharacterized protein n=1 Tax=Starmerella bacillaris TaxID=1247836 RepID=A0AAV5RMQ2_STABA|nr:hypothetical protein DASB73_033700 [Starmerella bacillaris]
MEQVVLDLLKARDETQLQLLPYFEDFKAATIRNNVDITSQDSSANNELIERLTVSRDELQSRLEATQIQLEQAYEKIRDLNEEKYLKTSSLQNLYDEILALTMQLNLSEEKRKRLQDELGR